MIKLQALKVKVYELAEVNTTQQLKAKYADIKTLDMRRKGSWEKALTVVQRQQTEFGAWLGNPPEEYKNLFSEIAEVSQEYDRKSAKVKQLTQEALTTAASLETLAEECQDEANQLKQNVKASRKDAKRAELN
jgi:chromosome segregation ATPase